MHMAACEELPFGWCDTERVPSPLACHRCVMLLWVASGCGGAGELGSSAADLHQRGLIGFYKAGLFSCTLAGDGHGRGMINLRKRSTPQVASSPCQSQLGMPAWAIFKTGNIK